MTINSAKTMKTYEIQLDPLTLEAENLEQAKELAIEYFNEVTTIQKHEITEVGEA